VKWVLLEGWKEQESDLCFKGSLFWVEMRRKGRFRKAS
jgi:hypothetical protein